VFREGTALEALESVDSRRFLPHALLATFAVIVAPALVVVALSPLSGIADLLLSALLATGLSVAAGSVGSALWTRRRASREIPFGDLMLWAWARRVRAERRLARVAAGGAPLGRDGELATLRTLAVVYEARDGFSHGHSGRVARHAERIARRLGLAEDEIRRIEAAAAVHDVGMLRVPSAVAGSRSAEALALTARHAVYGAAQVEAAADPETAALVRHHHERVDGSGYPDGLAGDEIPLGARIIAVADRFDELASPAPGRRVPSRRNALDELSARAGSELDAAVVAAFAGYYSGVRSIAGVAFAATAPQRAVRWIAAAPATIGSAAGAPVVLQSVCAAGTAVLAGACMTGLPALDARGGGGKPGEQRAERAPAPGAADEDARQLAAAHPVGGDGTRGGPSDGPRAAGGDAAAPRTGRQQAPTAQGDQGGGGGAPVVQSPQTDGGGSQPTGGGDGGSGGGGGGSGGGGGADGQPTAPPVAQPSSPSQPPAPTPTPPPAPPAPVPVNPTSQVVDPLLDGVGDAVPPVKPITDAVKGIVGGLTGGLQQSQ
jgi:HD-GYP domain-containing protein (c-di-GMP phosphodiesterase class II)